MMNISYILRSVVLFGYKKIPNHIWNLIFEIVTFDAKDRQDSCDRWSAKRNWQLQGLEVFEELNHLFGPVEHDIEYNPEH